MEFDEILFEAKKGDKTAIEKILEIYRPLLVKNALINRRFDEDLYQELIVETIRCILYYKTLE